jgi:hypothetical protein
MQCVDVLDRKVFEKARRMPYVLPEMFAALEEYDRTRILKRWGNKVRINFTLDPMLYSDFKKHCKARGYKMSTLIQRLIGKELNMGL